MNSRFTFSAKACLLSAAACMILSPTIAVIAQNVKDTGATKPRRSSTPKQTNATGNPLKSAVQRELDELYARDGNTAPKLTLKAARAQRRKQADPKNRTRIRKPIRNHRIASTKPRSKKRKPNFLRSLLGKTKRSNSHPKRSVAQSKKSQKVAQANKSKKTVQRPQAGTRGPVENWASQSRPSVIRKVGREVPNVKQTSNQPNQPNQAAQSGNKSAVERELEKLYKRDGARMPSMKISDLPIIKGTPIQSRDLTKRPGGATRRSSSVPRFLKRFFPSSSKSRSRSITGSSQTPGAEQNPADNHRRSSTKPRLLPDILRRNIGKNSSGSTITVKPARKPQPVRIPQQFTPSADAQTAGKPRPVQAEPKENVANGAADDKVGNPFTEVSEEEADRNGNPYSGLTLDEGKPSKDKSQSIAKDKPAADQPRVVESKPKSDIPNIVPQQTGVAAKSKNAEVEQKLNRIAARSDQGGLKGFCPVALRDHRALLDVKPEFSATYKSKVYHFSSIEAKTAFEKTPLKYAPAVGGKDVTLLTRKDGILLTTTAKQIEGSLEHAVWYKDRLYLFTSRENMHKFVLAPSEYAVAE